jgi:hypothetical protein
MSEHLSRFQKFGPARSDPRSFVGGSNAPQGRDEATLPGGEHLSHNPPRDRANTKPSTRPIRAAHAEFVAILGQFPRAIPLDVDAVDLEDRADHLNKALNALSVYVIAALDDTAQNVPGGLRLPPIEAILCDLTSDITGTIQLAADAMAGRVA